MRTTLRIGTAGWAIPRAAADRFKGDGTHLQRYARHFTCAEINSSFHRPHTDRTYAKWRDSTPAAFRFAVKLPRLITHTLKLRNAREAFATFVQQTDGLWEKRGPLLMQLPPSFAFDPVIVTPFLDTVREIYGGPLVCEPRHATWFTADVAALLNDYQVSRVIADPPPVPEATQPAGWPGLIYLRLHGAPRTYWSRYEDEAIASLTDRLRALSAVAETWCVFDNTASGAAIENALEVRERLEGKVD